MPDSQQSQIARLAQRADDFEKRLERQDEIQRSFANETGARIRVETELAGDLKGLRNDLDDLEERWDKMDDRIREGKRFRITTYIAVGGLVCTALVIVIGVIGLVH